MSEKDHVQTESFTKQIDPFSKLMFGKGNDDGSNGENKQEFTKQDTHIANDKSNNFDNWMFGPKQIEKNHENHITPNQIEDFLNNIDFVLLMETIDSIHSSSKQLMPLVKKLIPYLGKFKST